LPSMIHRGLQNAGSGHARGHYPDRAITAHRRMRQGRADAIERDPEYGGRLRPVKPVRPSEPVKRRYPPRVGRA